MDLEQEISAFMRMREFNSIINISLKHKYVYLAVAKAACSTIKKRLLDYEVSPFKYKNREIHADIFSSPFVKPYQLDEETLRQVLFSGEFYRFSFVRNPCVRVLSAYLEKIVCHKPQSREVLRALDLPFDNDAIASTDLTFEEFIQSIEKTSLRSLNKHWRPQFMLLLHPFLEFDFIGKVESFEDDWAEVAAKIGLTDDADENVLWHQTSAREKLDQYYSSNLVGRVSNVYRKDFEVYGYESIVDM